MKIKFTSLYFFIFISINIFGQSSSETLKKWQLEDPQKDKFTGVAASSAYQILEYKKNSQPIIVAVMDGGTEIAHPDLKDKIWVNPKEIIGNNVDDDGNGYIDDINGWNFIGSKNGDVNYENSELTRLYKLGKDSLPSSLKWKRICKAYNKQLKDENKSKIYIDGIYNMLIDAEKLSNKTILTGEELSRVSVKSGKLKSIQRAFVTNLNAGIPYIDLKNSIKEAKEYLDVSVNYTMNPKFDGRLIVGDDIKNVSEKYYGNNNVTGPEALHGTHVAGIIGATRNNNEGIDGVADNVKLMIVRVVPDGDERDKDVANGIRYAVDNGAKIINMSFGKEFSPNKEVVDAAIKYADLHGVLLIHAAGNESNNNDVVKCFPNANLNDGTKANNWIEVGANDPFGNAASFSNYGKKSVDLFAPGLQIYSTLPNGKYGFESGTSMAAPVVAGIAALIWSNFPDLSVYQLKEVLLKSAIEKTSTTKLPGKSKSTVPFADLSLTGGIVNCVNAIKLAEIMTTK